ncbi:MAG: YdbL family protein [Opitutales bacterium]|nr:YdbL family protein [Opitutales bacterium]
MKTLQLFLTLWFGFFASATFASADDVESITERLKERLEIIDPLKASGDLGENNRGLLEVRGDLSREQRETVQAENSDRQKLYELVAQRTRQSVDAVARQRAARIAQLARSGVWLQNARGEWYRKE